MPGYKIKKEDNKYYFVLYPNNSNTQELGKSIKYNTIDSIYRNIDSEWQKD